MTLRDMANWRQFPRTAARLPDYHIPEQRRLTTLTLNLYCIIQKLIFETDSNKIMFVFKYDTLTL